MTTINVKGPANLSQLQNNKDLKEINFKDIIPGHTYGIFISQYLKEEIKETGLKVTSAWINFFQYYTFQSQQEINEFSTEMNKLNAHVFEVLKDEGTPRPYTSSYSENK